MIISKEDIIFVDRPNQPHFNDLTNKSFGKLNVLGYAGRMVIGKHKRSSWFCLCECGNYVKIIGSSLKSGNNKSCGHKSHKNTTHNMSKSSEYHSYQFAKNRCNNESYERYHDYGGRGIEFRFNSFEEFYAELGDKPEPKKDHSVDRINNNGHYERGNVRWEIQKNQARNRRSNYFITLNKETKCIQDWAHDYKISFNTLWKRIKTLKWCDYCSVTIPPNKSSRGANICSHII